MSHFTFQENSLLSIEFFLSHAFSNLMARVHITLKSDLDEDKDDFPWTEQVVDV